MPKAMIEIGITVSDVEAMLWMNGSFGGELADRFQRPRACTGRALHSTAGADAGLMWNRQAACQAPEPSGAV